MAPARVDSMAPTEPVAPRRRVPGSVVMPAQVPDTVPSWVFSASNVLRSPRYGGRHYRGLVVVALRTGTTARERAAVLRESAGRVIGGRVHASVPGQVQAGYYYLLVPDDGTVEPVYRAIERLERLPQVEAALPGAFLCDIGDC